jgi:putative transcriptional regulator
MEKDDFEKLMAGAQDALAYAEGDRSRGVAHSVSTVDVAAIRKKLDLSQAQFADTFGLEKSAVQEWEHGRRRPDRAARVLLRVIERNPQAVKDALRPE